MNKFKRIKMMTILKEMNELDWVDVCALDDLTPNTGVGALIEHQQIAIFRVGAEKRVYALSLIHI